MPLVQAQRLILQPLAVAAGLLLAGAAQAQSLQELYDAARGYDATYLAVRATADAAAARAAQAEALLRPTLGLQASGTQAYTDPASTSHFVATVFDLKRRDPATFAQKFGAQAEASEAFARAVTRGSAADLVQALSAQHRALQELGDAAGAPIVVDAVRQLHERARAEGGCVLPSGAGGGDVSLYAGLAAPSPELLALARRLGQKPLDLGVGALGLSPIEPPTFEDPS